MQLHCHSPGTIRTLAAAMCLLLTGPASAGPWSRRAGQVARERLAAAVESPSVKPAAASPAALETEALLWASDHPTTRPAETEASSAHDEQPPAPDRDPLPGFFATARRDLRSMPATLWQDARSVFGNPYNVLFLAGVTGATCALRDELDRDIESHYERHRTFSGDWPDAFGALGNPGTHFALAGAWYLVGQQLPDAKTYQVGKQMFSVLTITGLTTMLGKVAAWDDSPNGEWGAWPSGHVSSTMAMATVLNRAYGPLAGVPMFGLTALVGIERLQDGEHYFSDVIAGAAIGWVVAETVMKERSPEVFGGRIIPYVDPAGGGAGLAWLKPLGQ